MADSSLSGPLSTAKRSNWADLLAQAAFGAFLLLIFVGLEPFSTRAGVEAQTMATGEGDVIRQIIFVVAFTIVVGLAFAFRGQLALRAFPISLAIVLCWCLLSVGWAIEPSIAARRLLLALILISCVMFGVDTLGPTRSLQVLRLVMAVILVVNLVSLLVIPQAVHLPGELESELAGNWRGMHNHKNIAGPIAALSALLFFHFGLATRRWSDWLLFFAAVTFLVGTQSKTAIGFFGACIAISTTYRMMCRSELGRQLFMYLFIGVLLIVAGVWLVAYEQIADLMSDPSLFTGRVAIWQKVFAYVRENPLLGAGFGSFWQIGEASNALSLNSSAEKWILLIPHSHNGYLEILVTTGSVGLILSVIAFVIIPIKQVLGPSKRDLEMKSLLLSILTFVIFSNFLETIYFNRDLPEWVIFLVVLAILHQLATKGPAASQSSPVGG